MSNFDEFFPIGKGYEHPKLRFWDEKRAQPGVTSWTAEFFRKRDGLLFHDPRLYIVIKAVEGTLVTDSEPWDSELNIGLIEHGFRAPKLENEGERFGYMLKEMFKTPEIRFGDGFFNATLIAFLHSSPFSQHPLVNKKLADIHENKPHMEGQSYQDCMDKIKNALIQCGHWLVDESMLNYSRDEATNILAAAIAYFLDERFSITNRKLLGW